MAMATLADDEEQAVQGRKIRNHDVQGRYCQTIEIVVVKASLAGSPIDRTLGD